MLDDIFSEVFFTLDGDLFDVSSDEDVDLNVTLPSISSSEGRAHTPFCAIRGTGGQPRLNGSRKPLRTHWSISTSPVIIKREKVSKIQHGGDFGGTGRSANAGLSKVSGCIIGRGPAKMARQC